MKPAPFAYAAPADLDEAVALLDGAGDGARVLAGGQSLVMLMNAREVTPGALVDLNGVSGLDGLAVTADAVEVGAMVRSHTLATDAEVTERLPVLAEAARRVGHPAVRNRGTLGGNVAFADPASNFPVVAVALDATIVTRSASGAREHDAAAFFLGARRTALARGEIVERVRFPLPPPGAGSAYHEVSRRSRGWGLAGAAVALWLDDAGRIGGARIAIGGVQDAPLRATGAEGALAGAEPGAEAWAAAASAARAAVTDPREDVGATAAYRRHLAGVVVERALAAASERCGR